ncbi:MAG: cation:proton antiporter [Acidimicrobiales bacterium]
MVAVVAQAAPAAAPSGLPADQVAAFVFLGITLIIVAARLCGAAAVRLGQPRVVGEIVAGVLLGPSLLGPSTLVWDGAPAVLACDRALAPSGAVASISSCLFPPQARPVLGVIGQLALMLFMFLVGLQLDLGQLRGRVAGVVSVAVGVVVVPLAAGFALLPVLYDGPFVAGFGTDAAPSRAAFALMIGSMLSVTAFPVAARILQEKGLDRSDMGAVGIAAAGLVTLFMFLAVGVARGVAAEASAGGQVLRFVGAALFLAAMFVVVRPALARLVGALGGTDRLNGTVFAVCVATVIASGYAADRIGINVIVGGFVAGVIMPGRAQLEPQLATRLQELTITILLPVFLAFSGLQTDFTKLSTEVVVGLAAFIVVGVVSKWGAGLLFARLGGLSWAEGNVIGILMNCRGLLVLVVALLAVNQGVISAPMQVGAVLMALITTAMTGPLIDRYTAAVPAGSEVPAPAT